MPAPRVRLRDVTPSDLPIFFEQQRSARAHHMAAFTPHRPDDRAGFDAHWSRILADPSIVKQTIVQGRRVLGHVLSFELLGEREVSYWLGEAHWGQGHATTALAALLAQIERRPLYARAVKDNLGSLRVLQKCGFQICGEDRGFASGRGVEVEEFVLRLD